MSTARQRNPLRALTELGQSLWLDDIRRIWLRDGTFLRLIDEDGLAGVTSNPAIFAKAIESGAEYRSDIESLARKGVGSGAIYESLALADVRAAADLLRPVYQSRAHHDGFVSLEVSPHLADDTEATLREARRLWAAFDRPNAMIKVPATRAGLPAIRTLIAEGVNVNVTLLFGLTRYREVVDAFLSGLEQRAREGAPLDRVASVASFFVSRIDTLVDKKLDALGTPEARRLRGQAAIASARCAYGVMQEWMASERWSRLADRGARVQRLLWASTSTKDPAYPDTKYVEPLIGPHTVNTMPRSTLDAYRDHGQPALRVTDDPDGARAVLRELESLGIDPEAVRHQLEREGVRKFIEPFDELHAALARFAQKAS
ncbi:MAG: transaldolase [Steroidobacteraceae bacterium]|nr:transaldolase [Steroidobacteraceae bacterium]